MSQVEAIGWIKALDCADGTAVQPDSEGWVTLTSGHTYVFARRVSDQQVESFTVATDATIVISALTVETTNAPTDTGGAGTLPGSVTDWDNSANSVWVKQNSPTAYVPVVGASWTVAAATLSKTAGLGVAQFDLSDIGCSRVRLKVAVTTGATMRVAPWGKS